MKLTPTDVERLNIDIPAIWDMVLQFRQNPQVQEKFARPSTHDSLLFACTEVAEAIDAKLRENAEYSRNNVKSLEVESELADHAIMLITAHSDLPFVKGVLEYVISNMTSGNTNDIYAGYSRMNLLDALYMRSANILRDFHAGSLYAWKINCIYQMVWICGTYPNFHQTVKNRLDRLYNKHVSNS